MLKSITTSQCWKNLCHIPANIKSTLPHLVEDFCRLQTAYKEEVCKGGSKKLSKVEDLDALDFRRVDIIVNDEPTVHSRTEQLSFPKASKMTELLGHPVYPTFSVERKKSVNNLIKKTACTLYSYLSKPDESSAMEEFAPPPRKMTKEEYREHVEYIDRLAKPKACVKDAGKCGRRTPSSNCQTNLNRRSGKKVITNNKKRKLASPEEQVNEILERLSKPRLRIESLQSPWQLTETLRTYEPSVRILEMAQPKLNHLCVEKENPFGVKKSALCYEPTPRICELACPPEMKIERKLCSYEDLFKVKPEALCANATERIKELSQPKQNCQFANQRRDPFRVRQRALRAKASRRLRCLAEPKLY